MKNFIFDLYGTLIDIWTDESDERFRTDISEAFFRLCGGRCDFWKEYKQLCLPPDGDANYEPDLMAVFRQLAAMCGGNPTDAQLEDYAYNFRRASRKRLQLYPEAKEILRGLRARGAKVYLLSNAQACFTRGELKETDIGLLFDGILLSSEAGVKKPDRRFFNKIIDRYSLDVKQTVYTGNDYFSDVCGAKAAGLYSAYIMTYDEAPIEKVRALADFVALDFTALKNKLFELAEAE